METYPIPAITDVPAVYGYIGHRNIRIARMPHTHFGDCPRLQGPVPLFYGGPRKHLMQPPVVVADVNQILHCQQVLGGFGGYPLLLTQLLDWRILQVFFKQLLPGHPRILRVQAKSAFSCCYRVGYLKDVVGVFLDWHKNPAQC